MAKRSRRARRQATEKQRRSEVTTPEVSPEVIETEVESSEFEPETPVDKTTASIPDKEWLDFVKQYAYVYLELRNVVLIGIAMFVVMAILSFFI